MALSSNPNTSFLFLDPFQDALLDHFTEDRLIQLIVMDFNPKRRIIATRQLKIYIKKLMSYPSMRPLYITKIKQLIQYEKTLVKKE